ncbi:MAG: phosphate ABC transporter permease PstA, partial [Planctomycetes bacterium]|nr:phosphate ABC transporter permease PstA [Planctomycetota bacterium]
SSAFAIAAAGSLGLGVLVIAILLLTTVREASLLTSMHATASSGVALVQRVASGVDTPYVSIAQVAPGSAAERLGLHQGDALVALAGTTLRDVKQAWHVVGALPDSATTADIAWVPGLETLLGEVELDPVAEKPSTFRARLAYVGTETDAGKQGFRDGDVLLAANGNALFGSQQAWQTLVATAATAAGPLQVEIERGGARMVLPFTVRRTGTLPLQRSFWAALWRFCTSLDERRYPEQAGLASAIVGSLLVVLVTVLFAFPLGIAAAVYLEEYAKKSRLTSVLQVLIANLAGIPSVVYGIIGLEVIDRTLGLGRSVLTGGLTLGLLILPVMILGCRESLRTVPPWVRHAAFAVGATPSQVVWYQVLPYALPGMLTAMILAVSRAIGEAAPVIMLAYLFLTFVPTGLSENFTVMPIQIFTWAMQPQAGFENIAAVAILVLLVILLGLNGAAIVLRNRFQLRW